MEVPRASDGVLAVDMALQNGCDGLRVACFCDGVSVRVLDELPAEYVRCGNVIFGISADGDLSTIHLASMSSEETGHARSVLMGEELEGDFEPIEG